jgi:hypothetical protein
MVPGLIKQLVFGRISKRVNELVQVKQKEIEVEEILIRHKHPALVY